MGGDEPMMMFRGDERRQSLQLVDPEHAPASSRCSTTAGFAGVSTVWEEPREEHWGGSACTPCRRGDIDHGRLLPRKPRLMSVRGGDRGGAAGAQARAPAEPDEVDDVNVGIVSKWFNRGQPVVGRYIRSAVDELGHRSFVLAKPRREKGPMAGALERTGVWDQPGVTAASSFETPLAEYEAWVEANSLDVILCDQNYQFDELARASRRRAFGSIGRFVWEHFTARAPRAGARGLRRRLLGDPLRAGALRGMGARDPAGAVGHPSGAARACRSTAATTASSGSSSPADSSATANLPSRSSRHSPRRRGDNLRLLVKAQVERSRLEQMLPMIEADERIELRLADEPWHEHLAAVAANDVSLSPSRWEGLGLPLYEAVAFGMPTIANDDPPMNEVVVDGVNGILVPSLPDGTARSGIPAKRPDIGAMTGAIERIAEPDVLARLRNGAERSRGRPPLGADGRRARRAAERMTGRIAGFGTGA